MRLPSIKNNFQSLDGVKIRPCSPSPSVSAENSLDKIQLNLLDLPSEVYYPIVHTLDAKSIASMHCTTRRFRDDEAINAVSFACSLRHKSQAYLPHDADFSTLNELFNNSARKCEKIPVGFRKLPILALLQLCNLNRINPNVRQYSVIQYLAKSMNRQAKSEILQKLIESVGNQRIEIRYGLLANLRRDISDPQLPHKSALYTSVARELLELDAKTVRLAYPRVKEEIENLPPTEQILPFAHLARVLPYLDSEIAETEYQFYYKLFKRDVGLRTIPILNGLLRGCRSFSLDHQRQLLAASNAISEHLISQSSRLSHMLARIPLIKAFPETDRYDALRSSINFWKHLTYDKHDDFDEIRPPEHQLILLPLAETINSIPADLQFKCFKAIAEQLTYPEPDNGKTQTYFQRCEDHGIAVVINQLIHDAGAMREDVEREHLVSE